MVLNRARIQPTDRAGLRSIPALWGWGSAAMFAATLAWSGQANAEPPRDTDTATEAAPHAKPRDRTQARATTERALHASAAPATLSPMAIAPAADERPAPKPSRKAKRSRKKKPAKDAKSSSDGQSGDDRKISLDEDFLVEGKLEKPNAFFILRRSQSAYDWARLDAKFLPLVLESVQDPLF